MFIGYHGHAELNHCMHPPVFYNEIVPPDVVCTNTTFCFAWLP